MGIFPEREDSRGGHGLGRLVEFRFKGPRGTTSSYITTHIIGTWASQPQHSLTLLPCPGGRSTKCTRTCCVIGHKKNLKLGIISGKIVWKIKDIFCSIYFSRKSARLRDNVKKYSSPLQATDDNTAHALDTYGYKHTLTICNSYCFPTQKWFH